MSSNTVLGILGLAAVASLAYSLTKEEEKEDYMFDLTYRTVPQVQKLSNNDMLFTRGQYQPTLAPRVFDGVSDYVRNGTADINNQGYNPRMPLGNSGCKLGTVENYSQIANTVSKGVVPEKVQQERQFSTEYVNTLPVGTMTDMDPSGNVEQVAVYDRFVYTTQMPARNKAGVNYFAGDLAIAPLTTSVFGNPDCSPGTDLQQGALFVMGGTDNDNSKNLLALQQSYKGGGMTTFSGVSLNESRNAYGQPLASGLTTQVGVTGFPY
jgi:hypothetical protein